MIRRASALAAVLLLSACFFGGPATRTAQPETPPPPPPAPTHPDIEEARAAVQQAEPAVSAMGDLSLDFRRARALLAEAETIWNREEGDLKPKDEEWGQISHLSYLARQRAAIAAAKARTLAARRNLEVLTPPPVAPARRSAAPPRRQAAPLAALPPASGFAVTPLETRPAVNVTPVTAAAAEPDQPEAAAPPSADSAPAAAPPQRVMAVLSTNPPQDLPPALQVLQPRVDSRGLVFLFGDERFVPGDAMLLRDNAAVLDSLVSYLRANPAKQVVVEGHADAQLPEAEARALSEGRARAVQDALLRRGLELSRVKAVGYGADRALAPADTAENRRQSRRVEVVLIGG